MTSNQLQYRSLKEQMRANKAAEALKQQDIDIKDSKLFFDYVTAPLQMAAKVLS